MYQLWYNNTIFILRIIKVHMITLLQGKKQLMKDYGLNRKIKKDLNKRWVTVHYV